MTSGGDDLKSARSVRLCLEKAIENAAPFLDIKFDADLYKLASANEDTKFNDVRMYLDARGVSFINRSQDFFIKGGPEVALLKQRTGIFVVHIGFTSGNDDKQPDHHSVFYHAELGRIIDSDPAVKIRFLEESDRDPTKEHARAVWKLAPSWHKIKTTIHNVFELRKQCCPTYDHQCFRCKTGVGCAHDGLYRCEAEGCGTLLCRACADKHKYCSKMCME
jgi:hypothetical protein